MELSKTDPFIRYAYSQLLRPTPYHTYSYDHRLIYVQSGSFALYCGEKKLDISENSLVMWHSGIPYRFETSEITRIIILNFDLTQSNADICDAIGVIKGSDFQVEQLFEGDELEGILEHSEPTVLDDMKYLENELMLIVSELCSKKRFYRETASAHFKLLLCEIARRRLSDKSLVDTVDRAIAYICENYQKPITNIDIADSVNYHEYYVNKLFLHQTGMTLHKYLLSYRLQSAQRLLITTDQSILRISEQCGFNSATYFISAFSRQFGKTPNEYRRQMQGM